MGAFIDYRAFRGIIMLMESPAIDLYHTPEVVNRHVDTARKWISDNHQNATSIGNDNFYNQGPSVAVKHIYYHKGGKHIGSVSIITGDNVQSVVSKGNDPTSEHLIHILHHHAATHGFVSTSETNTPGSMKLWKTAVANIPPELSSKHTHNKVTVMDNIDSKYLDDNTNTIWNKTSRAHNVIIYKKPD